METPEFVLLTVLTTLLSFFTILGIVVLILVSKLVNSARRVVVKAETAVDSVEEAVEVIKDAHGPLAAFKVIRNIIKIIQRSQK